MNGRGGTHPESQDAHISLPQCLKVPSRTTDMGSNAPSTFLPSETAQEFYIERTNFVSIPLTGVLYGIVIMLFVNVLDSLITGKPWRKVPFGLIAYIGALFAFATCYFGSIIKWAQDMWIDYRDQPGGPIGFYYNDFWIPISVFSSSVFIVTNFLADGLMLHRCWIIWNRSWLVVAFPCLIFLGSTALSCVAVFQVTKPGQEMFSNITLQFMLPYFSMSMGLNILVTLMISARLLRARRMMRNVLATDHSQVYISITAMLVESAALYSVFSIIFIATYARNDALFNVFLPLHSQIMCISPLLILHRVAKGQAFTEAVGSTGPGISLRNPSTAHGSGTVMDSETKGATTLEMGSAASLNHSKFSSNLDIVSPHELGTV